MWYASFIETGENVTCVTASWPYEMIRVVSVEEAALAKWMNNMCLF